MKKLIALMVVVVMACAISVPSVAENRNDTQMVEVYQHNYETNTTELVTIEVPTNASGEPYDVGVAALTPYAVIGSRDERERITTVTTSPYNKIVCLKLRCDDDGDGVADGTTYGTGFMVADDVMLTAAHLINGVDDETGNILEAVSMEVHWYQNGTTLNSNYCTPYTSWLPSDYDPADHTDNDWAIVKLNKPTGSSVHLGSIVGYFGYSSPSDETLSGMSVTGTGYPSDYATYRHFMYSANGNIYNMEADDENITPYYFRHNVDMSSGQSGSPVYNTNNIVVGIHVRGTRTHGYNEAMRITPAISGLIAAVDNMPFT